jgi:DNA-binding NarL/FixJ family response regulator
MHIKVLMMESTRKPIRIFIIDPQPLIAAALHHFFAANAAFAVVGSAQTVTTLVLRTLRPDVILLCQEHGSTDLCDLVSECRRATPEAKVCVVACHTHTELAARVIEAGADGYAIKDTDPAELLNAVIHLSEGASYLDPRVGKYVSGTDSTTRRIRTVKHLSIRETEVLKLIADGYSNREISIALSLSEKTIKNHVSRIFAKLHITARTQAVIHAIKTGIA